MGVFRENRLGHAEMRGQLVELRLVQVADRVDRRGHVAVLGAVAQQQLALVARAQHQALERRALVVEHGHPFPGALVGQPHPRGVGESGEIGVDLLGDRHVDARTPRASITARLSRRVASLEVLYGMVRASTFSGPSDRAAR